jgi:hypothetical protein
MGQLPVIVIIIVVIFAANLIARKVLPTRVSHGLFRRKLNYRGAVWFIMIGLLLLVGAVAAVFNL